MITCLAAAGLGSEQIKVFSLHQNSDILQKYVLDYQLYQRRKQLVQKVDSFINSDDRAYSMGCTQQELDSLCHDNDDAQI